MMEPSSSCGSGWALVWPTELAGSAKSALSSRSDQARALLRGHFDHAAGRAPRTAIAFRGALPIWVGIFPPTAIVA